MIESLQILFFFFIVVTIIWEFITGMTFYWGPVNLDGYKLNKFDYNIMNKWNDFNSPYIAVRNSLLSKYYIEQIGKVPRWSKLHNQIRKKFRQLHEEKLKQLL